MCNKYIVKAASSLKSDCNAIFYTSPSDTRWENMKKHGEVVDNWGKEYEEQYSKLMHKLLISSVGVSKGNEASSSLLISRLCTLASIANYNCDKKQSKRRKDKI